MHMHEEYAVTGRTHPLHDECSRVFFERCDEEAEELFCSYLLLLFVPQMHLSFTKLLVLSFNKSISWRQNTGQRMLVNVWK